MNPYANGNEFKQYVDLAAGTYQFKVWGWTQFNEGKIDWYLDIESVGTPTNKIVSLQDWYTVSSTPNVVKITTGVILTISGRYVLTGKINGKNASSSDYAFFSTFYTFTRIGA